MTERLAEGVPKCIRSFMAICLQQGKTNLLVPDCLGSRKLS